MMLSIAKTMYRQQHMNKICICSIGGMVQTGKNESTQRKTYPNAALSIINPTWTGLWSKPGRHNERVATNCL